MVEIAKALRSRARVLILDEPTAVLSHREIDHLFRILRDLRDQGMGLVYVSHRLDEIFEVCTDICVLKDGDVTSSGPIADYDHDRVVAAMVGRSLGELFPPKSGPAADAAPALSLRGLVAEGSAAPIDLDLRPGEIVGLAGLVGSGRTELALAIFGAARGSGAVELSGKAYGRRSPGRSLAGGLAMLTEDRKANGLFPEASVAWNFAASTLGKGVPGTRTLAAQRGGALPLRRRALQGRRRSRRPTHLGALRRQPAEGADRPPAGEYPEGSASR